MRRLFAVEGLACAGCARGLERQLAALPGVRLARVHYLTASALIDWQEAATDRAALAGRVAKAGYRLVDNRRPQELEALLAAQARQLAVRLAVAVVAGMWSMALALVLYFARLAPETAWWIALGSGLFALPVVFWAGAGFLWMGWRSIRLGDPGMDLLVSAGALGAMLLSVAALLRGSPIVWFDTATMLVTLLLLARLIDTATRRSALTALRAMEEAAPELATLAADRRRVAAAEVPLGARVIVDAGEAASVDGVVVSGQSLVNRAVLTGESSPITVAAGARIEAGSVNLSARLVIEVDREHGDREIDRMGGAIALEIARGGAERGMSELWSGWLVRGILLLALASVALGLALGRPVEAALVQGLALLAGLCPCALAVAVPLVRLRAAGCAARMGVRIRELFAFERLANARDIVFDKTGTLTEGIPRIVALELAPGISETELLAAAARAETGIEHPVARAVIARHGELGTGGRRGMRHAEAEDEAGRHIHVGAAALSPDGRSRLAVSRDGVALGEIVLEDVLLEQSAEVAGRLRAAGLRLHMATGDATAPAEWVARALGIAEVHAGCTPQGKAALMRGLAGPVAFIGDGVNDAPALAASACGLSIAGAHGAARQTADVAIVSGGIERLPPILALARASQRIARQNLVLSVGYNAVALPAAALGLLRPELAALAMTASSLSVVANTLRLGLRRREPQKAVAAQAALEA
ncbi:heavy metal translocating P-type ATPase [Cereibacter sphaeroides]|uniref:heavy metal translocating P-type ATPase n=1 Tax=Cereibacter sphaeroides TaxID=1063 RepID=UPI00313E0114